MYGRSLLAASLACLFPTACSGGGAELPPYRARSLVLFTVDTLRADQLGCYGGTAVPTPEVDRLAAEGLLFESAYSQATLTHPALSSMLTGLLPHRSGVHAQNNRLAHGVRTLATQLQGAGVATGSFVANLCKLQDEERTVFSAGWDEVFCGMDGAADQYLWDEAVVGAALDWIARQEGPYFAWIHLMDPHAEHHPSPADWDREARPLREKFDQYVHMNQWEERREMPPSDEYERLWALYAAEVAGVDRQLGRVLAQLDASGPSGAWDDTALVFSSDHGEELYETWSRYDHGFSLTEGVLWVPLVVRAPGVAPGRSDALVETLQVAPTALGLFGLTAPYALDGRSLLADEPSRGFALSFSQKVSISMRTPDHRYWLRTTNKPWTRGPDEAPWRADAPWFQRRQCLARYPGPSRTAVEWLPLADAGNRDLSESLSARTQAFMVSLGPLPKVDWIRSSEVRDELEKLGYAGDEDDLGEEEP